MKVVRRAVREMRALQEQLPEVTPEQLQSRLNAKVVANRRVAMKRLLGLQ